MEKLLDLIMRICLILALFIIALEGHSVTYYDRLVARGYGQYWLKIIHFKENNFFPPTSRVDNPTFFLHGDGMRDPEKEFNETVMAFMDTTAKWGEDGQPPQCIFPERYRIIKELNITSLVDVRCPDFEAFKKQFSPASVSLFYPIKSRGNITDYFGEVFLKLTTKDNRSYAGYFKMFEKDKRHYVPNLIRKIIGLNTIGMELSDFDTFLQSQTQSNPNDYLEIKLLLNLEEQDRLINHLWELKHQHSFNYYMIGENHAFFMADFLQVAKEEWDLISNNRFYFTPHDLVQNLLKYPKDIQEIAHDSSLKTLSTDLKSQLISHKKQRIEGFASLNENHPIYGIAYQAGYHGPLSSDNGYQAFSSFDFLRMVLSYDQNTEKYSIPEVKLLDYSLLNPISGGKFSFSQKGAIIKDHAEDIDLAFKSRQRIYYGLGVAFDTLGLLALFTGLEYQHSSYTTKSTRLGPWFEWNWYFYSFREGKLIFRQKLFSSFLEDLGNIYYLENEVSTSVSIRRNTEAYWKNQIVTKTGSFSMGQYKIMLGLVRYF